MMRTMERRIVGGEDICCKRGLLWLAADAAPIRAVWGTLLPLVEHGRAAAVALACEH